jgi:glycerophosphoryl diester phosphodiesterase
VREAHVRGLVVHPWTFRAEGAFLPEEFRRGDQPAAPGDLAGQLRAFLALGIDGFFTDQPDVGAAAIGRP